MAGARLGWLWVAAAAAALALAAPAAGQERGGLGVLAVAPPPGPGPGLVALAARLRSAMALRDPAVLDEAALRARMAAAPPAPAGEDPLRPQAGPGLALADEDRAAGVAGACARLALTRAVAVVAVAQGAEAYLEATLHAAGCGAPERTGRIQLVGGEPLLHGPEALAAWLLRAQPSELVTTAAGPTLRGPRPPDDLRRHDGFHGQLALLGGYLPATAPDRTEASFALALDVSAGGAVARDLLLGGHFWMGTPSLGPDAPLGCELGPELTWYLTPAQVFVSVSGGIAWTYLRDAREVNHYSDPGLGVHLAVGKAWWLPAPGWALGIEAQASYLDTPGDEPLTTWRYWGVMLGVTVSYQ